jgi:hypothetical protein
MKYYHIFEPTYFVDIVETKYFSTYNTYEILKKFKNKKIIKYNVNYNKNIDKEIFKNHLLIKKNKNIFHDIIRKDKVYINAKEKLKI